MSSFTKLSGTQGETTSTHGESVPLTTFSHDAPSKIRSSADAAGYDADAEIDSPASSNVGDGNLLAPLPSMHDSAGRFARIYRKGGLGDFLYRSSIGSHVYITFLVVIVFGCEAGLVILNRFLFMTGTWRFPYPTALTFAQVAVTHVLLSMSARLTRIFWKPLSWLGLSGLISPPKSVLRSSGFLGLNYRTMGLLLPLVITFVLKLQLSNLAFAYAILPKFTLARIYTVPASMVLTFVFFRTSHSLSTISSALTSVFYLGMASNQPAPPADLLSTILAFISSAFVALYPVLFLYTFNKTTKTLTPHENGHATANGSRDDSENQAAESHWYLLHHLSLLSLLIMTFNLIISGDIFRIWTGCYILDEFKLWIPAVGSFLTSFGVFVATPLLIRATSPLTVTFLIVPRSAFQLALLHGDMPVSCWAGVYGCYMSSIWYLVVRRSENGPLK